MPSGVDRASLTSLIGGISQKSGTGNGSGLSFLPFPFDLFFEGALEEGMSRDLSESLSTGDWSWEGVKLSAPDGVLETVAALELLVVARAVPFLDFSKRIASSSSPHLKL